MTILLDLIRTRRTELEAAERAAQPAMQATDEECLWAPTQVARVHARGRRGSYDLVSTDF
jgi:hypothetical protein